jgi:hypothetical protein
MRVRRIARFSRSHRTQQAADLPSDGPLTARSNALTEVEAADYIGMSAAWLKKSRTKRFRDLIDAPPFVRAGAKRVVYRLDDLDDWQERHLERVGPGELIPAHVDVPPRE